MTGTRSSRYPPALIPLAKLFEAGQRKDDGGHHLGWDVPRTEGRIADVVTDPPRNESGKADIV